MLSLFAFMCGRFVYFLNEMHFFVVKSVVVSHFFVAFFVNL